MLGPYDFPESFNEFAFMPKFEKNIEELATLAEPEDWGYQNARTAESNPILRNYIRYTYKRIAQEKKIAVTQDEQYACWNTGLVTPHQEPIYILFRRNGLGDAKTYWHFWTFARKGQKHLTRFAPLPEMAHYFEDPSTLVYDARKELRSDIEHIIGDNRDRFPAALQAMSDYGLQNLFSAAIERVIDRVKRNYKTAVPHYYEDSIQLLLPLCLTDSSRADMALVVQRFPDFYRAVTCLPLDWAYNNARQLARPDRDWLQP